MSLVTLHLLDFEVIELGSRYSKRSERLSWYEVRLDDKPIGGVAREIITRERRTPGKRYVNARWQSPGWRAGTGCASRYGGHRFECYSRGQGVTNVLRDSGVPWNDAKNLTRDAKVVKTIVSSSRAPRKVLRPTASVAELLGDVQAEEQPLQLRSRRSALAGVVIAAREAARGDA